jgi:protein-tyrosine-phosphatase
LKRSGRRSGDVGEASERGCDGGDPSVTEDRALSGSDVRETVDDDPQADDAVGSTRRVRTDDVEEGARVDVLVLCRANVARSPLAEVMLQAALPGVDVTSAGVRAREGYAAAEESQRLAAERGLDLSGHRSRAVTPELIARADLVLTMSESHRDLATPLAPRAAAKVFTLREFVRLTENLGSVTPPPGSHGAAPPHPHDATHLDPHSITPDPAHLDDHAGSGGGHPMGAGADRLAWLRDEAHLARPLVLRPDGPEDVADPMGRSWDRWVEMASTLDDLLSRVVALAGGRPPT